MSDAERVRVEVTGDSGDLRRALRAASADLKDFGRQAEMVHAKVGASADKAHLSTQKLAQSLSSLYRHTALIGTAGLAAQGISALGAAAVATTASLGPLAGALAAYPSLLSAVGQGFGTLKLATMGLSDALKAAQAAHDAATAATLAQKKAHDGTKASAKAAAQAQTALNNANMKYQEQLAQLAPAQRDFVREVVSLRPKLDELKQAAANGFLPGATKGIKDAAKNFEPLKKVIADTGDAFGQIAEKAGKMLGSRAWGKDIQTQGERNVTTIKRAGQVSLNLADALRNITLAAGPLISWMTRMAVHLSEIVDKQTAAGRSSGELAAFFRQTRIVMGEVARIAGDVAGALLAIGKAAYPVGSDVLKAITANADAFKRWTESARGQNAIRKFFQDARPAIDEIGRLMVALVQDFALLGQGTQVAPLLRMIRTQLLPAVMQMVDTTTKQFMPIFTHLAGQAIELFTKLGGSNGPLILVTHLLDDAVTAVNHLTDAIPGIGSAASSLMTVGGIGGALGLGSALGGVKSLSGMLGRLKGTGTIATGLSLFAERGATPAKPLFVWSVNGSGGIGGLAGTAAKDAERAGGGLASRLLGRLGAGALAGPAGLAVGATALGSIALVATLKNIGDNHDIAAFNQQLRQLVDQKNIGGLQALRSEFEKYSSFPGGIDKARGAIDQAITSIQNLKNQLDPLGKDAPADLKKVDDAAQQTGKHFQQLFQQSKVSLQDIKDVVRSNSEDIASTLGKNTDAGRQAMAQNFKQAAAAVQQQMQIAGKDTKAGIDLINRYLASALKDQYGFTLKEATNVLAGRNPNGGPSEGTAGPFGTGAQKPNLKQKVAITKAGGGWIGSRGMVGPDSVPAMLAPGEAVLNRHQQVVVEGMLGPGFLDRLFSSVTTPHYAGGGKVPAPAITGGGALGLLMQSGLNAVAGAASSVLDQVGATTSGGSGGGAPAGSGATPTGSLKAWLTKALQVTHHYSAANLSALTARAIFESSGNPHAINLYDINAQEGHPSKGLLQTIDSTFASYALPGHGDIWNPVDNAIAAIRYMFARYGHIMGNTGQGYARGGFVQHFAGGGGVKKGRPSRTVRQGSSTQAAIRLIQRLGRAGGPAKGISNQLNSYVPPTRLDYLNAALAQAQLTSGMGDDIAAMTAIRDYDLQAYQAAVAGGDPRTITQAATDLKAAQDALAQMTTPAADNGLAAIQLAQAQDALRTANVQNAGFNVLAGFAPLIGMRLVGSFAHGADRVRETGLAVVHKDERIIPDAQGPYGSQLTRSGDPMHVHITVATAEGEVLRIVDKRIQRLAPGTTNRALARSARLMVAAPGGR